MQRTNGNWSSYLDGENTVKGKAVSANIDRMGAPRPFLETALPFEERSPPVRRAGSRRGGRGGGTGEAGFCSPLTPWLQARPPPSHSAGGFDLISLPNRHTLVDNSGRHQNPSTSPSSACSLQKLQALLMGPGQVCSVSQGLEYSVSTLRLPLTQCVYS